MNPEFIVGRPVDNGCGHTTELNHDLPTEIVISLNHYVTAQITHSKISRQNVTNKTGLRV